MATPADNLPIREARAAVLAAMARSNRLIVSAPTGSGKSTQIPQMLLDGGAAGDGQILVLQPRRLAARMLARRVAAERGVRLGTEVGFQVRLDTCAGPRTRIKFVTDGVALRHLLADPALRAVGTIVFDEFHERRAGVDVVFGLARRLQATCRPDLRIVVMSATLDLDKLRTALAPCELVTAEGRTFPVTIAYLDRPARFDKAPVWDVAARAFEQAAPVDGDVLIFMPGAYEIRRTAEAVARTAAGRACLVLPLHGELRAEDQDAALAPARQRKVVVATNVAETSLTIDGIVLVIDSGLARKAAFDPHRAIDTLLIERISRASADQRAGRAGRTRPGRCLRLWTEREHGQRPEHDPPEVQRIDLAEIVLALHRLGIAEPAAFDWLDAPPPAALARAAALLRDLGAIDPAGGAVTPTGERLLAFPLHPRLARMLLAAEHYGCVPTLALIAALEQERGILLPRQNRNVLEQRERVLGGDFSSDLLLAAAAWRQAREQRFDRDACAALGIHGQTARRVGEVRDQFLHIAERVGLDSHEADPPDASIAKCILAGFADRLARRLGRGTLRCALVHGRRATLEKDSAAREADLLVATEINEIGRAAGDVEVRLAQATAVEPAWLHELFPGDLHRERQAAYDRTGKQVTVFERLYFHDLMLEEARGGAPTDEEAADILAGLVLAGDLTLKTWDHAVEQWIARVNLLARHGPETGVPAIDDAARRELVRHICAGARGVKDIKTRPVMPAVQAWLSRAQRAAVDKLAPERITLSNGRTPRVVYEPGKPPHIAMRIQELYGVDKPIAIVGGAVRVVVHVLAPNQRPVQITDDLGSFWRNGYAQARKELRGRYPKHEWR